MLGEDNHPMQIVINGKKHEVLDGQHVLDCKNALYPKADVVIVNGFQTNENVLLRDGDVVSLIQKGVMPSEQELESMMSARHTPQVHDKVKRAKVAIAGLGGLGSNIAAMLARTGVGELLLVDFDVVEPSNLNRQSYYICHLGQYKTDALKSQLTQINPFITVHTKTTKVEADNIKELFAGYDIVCEAFDNPAYKAILVNGLLEELDCKIVAASGMAGYFSSNTIQTQKKLNRLYLCGDQENAAKPGMGLMAPRVNICAGHQANMVLRLLLGLDEA